MTHPCQIGVDATTWWNERGFGRFTREIVRALAERYRASSRGDKTRILDEFVRVTGYHRKHAASDWS